MSAFANEGSEVLNQDEQPSSTLSSSSTPSSSSAPSSTDSQSAPSCVAPSSAPSSSSSSSSSSTTSASSNSATSAPLSIDDFAIGDKIGRGRFGHVFRVKKKDSGKIYAMKVLFKAELVSHNCMPQLVKEVEVQNKMRHKYVLRLLGVCQDAKRVYLFTDLAEKGSLYALLKKAGKFSEQLSGKYLRQLLNALTYLHQKSIVHRDIKPENLLLSSGDDLLLADFGWCTEIDEGGRLTVCGTPDYLPPEMITHSTYTNVIDSWTCGVLLYEFLTGRAPFTGLTQHETFANILSGTYVCPPSFSEGVISFLGCALRVNADKRWNAGELFMHPWTQEQDESYLEPQTTALSETSRKRDNKNSQKTVSGHANASAATVTAVANENKCN